MTAEPTSGEGDRRTLEAARVGTRTDRAARVTVTAATAIVVTSPAPTAQALPPRPLPPTTPRYIRACAENAWSLYLTKGGRRWVVPYRCQSWRHEGPCRRKLAQRTFARLRDPLDRVDPAHVLMFVLTFDQSEMRVGFAMEELGCALRSVATGLPQHPGDVRFHAFKTLQRRWQSLRQALHREAKRRGVRRARWALTVESHRSGWPHAHVIVEWPWLAEELAAHGDCARVSVDAAGQERDDPMLSWLDKGKRSACSADCPRAWVQRHAVACGFGPFLPVMAARDRSQAAGYILKLTGEVELAASAGELVKLSQLPTEAPPHFRRLRYSLRSRDGELDAMLDPSPTDPELTGALCNQAPHFVEAAVLAGLDLVDRVDPDTGEVTRVPFVEARAGPNSWAGTTWDERMLPFLMAIAARDQERTLWVAENCPEYL